jgi:glutamate-1-semialdehyde 2,1-aminomutase
MIMDEVITGFRLAPGGAQEYYGVTPDLTILGKIIMHGYPSCGAVAGRKDVMAMCSAGAGGAMGKHAFVAGTMAANSISASACYYATRLIEEHNAIEKAAAYADRLTAELNHLYETRPDLPFFAYNMKSIIIFETTAFFSVDVRRENAFEEIMYRKKVADEYQIVTANRNIMGLAGSRMYTCMQHDNEALERTLEAWDHLLSLIPRKK